MAHTPPSARSLFAAALILALAAFSAGAVDLEAFRTFTDTAGRDLEARLVSYDPYNGTVELLLTNGKTGSVSTDQLSAADHAFLELWQQAQQFLSNELLEITVTYTEADWEEDKGLNLSGERRDHFIERFGVQERQVNTFTLALNNHGSTTLTNLTIEYCQYRIQDDDITPINSSIEVGDMVPGTPFAASRNAYNFRRGGNLIVETPGTRIRISMTLEDGTRLMREICTPAALPLDKYPWIQSAGALTQEKADQPDPASYPDKPMSSDEIRSLAKQYIKAFEDEDYETWKALLSPMHPGAALLKADSFKRRTSQFKEFRILGIDGYHVKLKIKYESGLQTEGWLLLHSSGHIKYTPSAFRHPVAVACLQLSFLLDENASMRNRATGLLKRCKIPLYEYDADAPSSNWTRNAKKILKWLEDNGTSLDPSEPRVFLPQEAMDNLIEQSEQKLQNAIRYL